MHCYIHHGQTIPISSPRCKTFNHSPFTNTHPTCFADFIIPHGFAHSRLASDAWKPAMGFLISLHIKETDPKTTINPFRGHEKSKDLPVINLVRSRLARNIRPGYLPLRGLRILWIQQVEGYGDGKNDSRLSGR